MRRFAVLLSMALGLLLYVVPQHLGRGKHDALLFFDGMCNLCDGFVNFVADNDSKARVKFGAIQRHSEFMRSYGAGRYAMDGEEELSTLVLILDGQLFVRSEAALRTMALLDPPVNYLSALISLPRPLRDLGYKLVAKYRYSIFGQTETCRPPTPRFQQRFLDYLGPQDEPMPWTTAQVPPSSAVSSDISSTFS